jgi:GT2 family glycosyltransferase
VDADSIPTLDPSTLDRPRVSVTVVAYNSASCIEECVVSVCGDVHRGFAEIFVVDNASPDDSVKIAKRACPQTTIIHATENRYFAAGCNLSWPQVRGDYWLLLNPDVTVPPGGLRKLVTWMDNHPEIGAATPNLVDATGRLGAPARSFPSLWLAFLRITRLHRLIGRRRRANLFLGSYFPGGEHLDVGWVTGAALIVRREVVQRVGLLSEAVPMYGEDSEWCWRIRQGGYRIAMVDQVWTHSGEGSTRLTWSADERRERIWRGIYASCRYRRGTPYTIVLWLVNLLGFAIEVILLNRSRQQRETSRAILVTHLRLALRLLPVAGGTSRPAVGEQSSSLTDR